MAFQGALDNLSIKTEFSAPGNFIVAYISHTIPASVTRRKGPRALLYSIRILLFLYSPYRFLVPQFSICQAPGRELMMKSK